MASFILNQILALLQPIGFVWGCLLLMMIAFGRCKQRMAMTLCGLLMALMYMIGSTDFPGSLMRKLERPFLDRRPETLPQADAIVMLGGASEPARYEAGGMHLSFAADRVVMALELARLGKAPVLVLGGGEATFPDKTVGESATMKRWMETSGLTHAEIIALPRCGDTHDEALNVRNLAIGRGWKRVLLVTSANHMRRALATFRTAGVDAIAAPCNFFTDYSLAPSPPGIGVPRAGGFAKMEIWIHEQIGWFVYRRRGWISDAEASAGG
jgi:uncharacterized SAM-binding protein YcdF (DUF218 family)